MEKYPGVSTAYKKSGTPYYRASITYNQKHISLGSYDDPSLASQAYKEASQLLQAAKPAVEDYSETFALSFPKYVSLINLRNNGIYIKTPIYLYPDHFLYYFSPDHALKFDRDDLFFYSSHTIQKKGGYLFVCHYGSQYGILSRYGIHPFAVAGKDYIFVNGDNYDYRYDNIKVINHYMGVTEEHRNGRIEYTASIHINGSYILGRYSSEAEAAVAYNKAADLLNKNGLQKHFIRNYISDLSSEEYKTIYQATKISEKINTILA